MHRQRPKKKKQQTAPTDGLEVSCLVTYHADDAIFMAGELGYLSPVGEIPNSDSRLMSALAGH